MTINETSVAIKRHRPDHARAHATELDDQERLQQREHDREDHDRDDEGRCIELHVVEYGCRHDQADRVRDERDERPDQEADQRGDTTPLHIARSHLAAEALRDDERRARLAGRRVDEP